MNLQSALDAAGVQSSRIETLGWLFFAVCGLVYLAVVFTMLLAVTRDRADHTSPATGARVKRTVSLAVGGTVIILFGFFLASVATGKAVSNTPKNPQPLAIEITGHQWWWEVVYPDAVASNIVHTANEIHVPAGRPVALSLTSEDVIHSFWVPNLAGKTDLIPGRTNTMWFTADRTGVYRGQCAEYCGLQHAHMSLEVIAQDAASFDQWLANERSNAVEPTNSVTARGREVFLAAPCVLCHSIRGAGAFGQVAPDLTHIGARRTIASGTLPNTIGHLGAWITDPQKIKPGVRMPPMSIVSEDMQPLLNYLESLK